MLLLFSSKLILNLKPYLHRRINFQFNVYEGIGGREVDQTGYVKAQRGGLHPQRISQAHRNPTEDRPNQTAIIRN